MRTLTALALVTTCAAASAQEPWPGQTVFHPFFGSTTYLIDEAGDVIHTWPGTATAAAAVYYLGDGELLRTRNTGGSPISGEELEVVSWDGTVLWNYQYDPADCDAHHDVEPLPNGNVLIVAWDYKTAAEAVAAGRDPALIPGGVFAPDKVIEVQPTSPTDGVIVWEWNLWDHLVQDFDPMQANFGVVADHPELVDINFQVQPTPTSGDWNHFNSIAYNPELDQIVLSALYQREIWIIDHSTTTEEAAGHTGGNCGSGGDLIYRWGNPMAYDRGTAADQTLYGTHNVHWIPPGLPGAGNLLCFNNGYARPEGTYSTADELVPPLTSSGCYALAPGMAYGPDAAVWTYAKPVPTDMFSSVMGGVERQPNGNTLLLDSDDGDMFEVSAGGDIVWEYTSPFPGGGGDPRVFRATRQQICLRPQLYCIGAPNSVGGGASIGFNGGFSVGDNDLVLRAQGVPPGQPALFYYGVESVQEPFGDGFRCVGGHTVRLLPPGNADGAGAVSRALHLEGPPSTGGEIEAGTSWSFQLWYRDPAAGGAGFNLSDALRATFCP